MFSVNIREKDGDVEKLQFDVEEISIGRVQGNDIALPKGNVSKRHARIVQRDNGFVIVDLRSTNGTYVNGRKISAPTMVNEDDKVYIGDFVIQIHSGDADEIKSAKESPADALPDGSDEDIESAIELADFEEEDEGLEIIEQISEVEPGADNEESEAPSSPQNSIADVNISAAWPYVEAMAMLHDHVQAEIFQKRSTKSIDLDNDWDSLEDAVYSIVEKAQNDAKIPSSLDVGDLTSDLLYEFTGLGPIEHFLARDDVTTIEVNAYDHIFVHIGATRLIQSKVFSSPQAYLDAIHRLIREHTPFDTDTAPSVVTGRLEGGAIFRIVQPPTSLASPALTVSKPIGGASTIQGLVEDGSMSDEMATYLSARIGEDRASVAIAGAGRYERTYLLNSLTRLINDQERLIVLEGEGNVAPNHDNVVQLDPCDPSALEAVQALEANRLIASGLPVGDLAEFLLLSAGALGGSMFGIYAPSADQMVSRIKSILSVQVEAQSAGAIFAAGIQAMLFVIPRDEAPPLISRIVELSADDKGKLKVTDIFRYDDSKSKPSFVRV